MASLTAGLPANSTVPQIIDHIWQWVSSQINTGNVNNIRLPITFKPIIGQQGFENLADRFRQLIQAPVTMFEDQASGTMRLQPTNNRLGRITIHDAPEPKIAARKKEKVPRPPNAFILYRQHHHPLIKAKDPEIHNNLISVILGRQWKAEKKSTRYHYETMATALKAQHMKDHPDYSYKPRKSAEKKRRMTRKKAAMLADLGGMMESPNSATYSSVTSTESQSTGTPHTSPVVGYRSDISMRDPSEPLPEFDTTDFGNVVLTLGNEDLDDGQLLSMLNSYNRAVPLPATLATTRASHTPAIIYSEPTAEVQDTNNFIDGMMDWPAIEKQHNSLAEYLEMMYNMDIHPMDGVNQSVRTKMWDRDNAYLQFAEAKRQSTL